MNTAIRHPAVAGKFYPGDRAALAAAVRSYLSAADEALPTIGVLVPHAGYMYSGAVAGAVFAAAEIPEICIVLCPNHTGKGPPLSILSGCAWETPLGVVEPDEKVAEALKKQFPLLTEDAAAHQQEHAIEVELPFLLERNPRVRIVPIALGTRHYEVLEGLGEAVAAVVDAQSSRVLIVASSDMNHYENDTVTRVKDGKAIDRLLALDPRGLFDVAMREDISMCGLGPAVVMLTAARRLGAKSAQLARYATSGDVSGDRDRVVGYAGILLR